MRTSRALPLLLALVAAPAFAQTVATGAGREDELSQAQRMDAWIADAPRPSPAAQGQVTPAEAAAARAALPPMAADSPWARGVVTPTDGPLTLAGVNDGGETCDHRVHGEVGGEIGTRGTRGAYGVASMPVGKDCQVRVTVGAGTERGPRWRGGAGELNSASVRVDAPNFTLGVSGGSSRGPY